GARPGDALVLTKPLGTGIAATAVKAEMAEPELADAAVKWMTKLNDLPRFMRAELRASVSAATDVTGFGFAGHALDMLSSHNVDLELDTAALPTLPGAAEMASMGLLPAGAYRNEKLYAPQMDGLEKLPQEVRDLLFDPQTSGGLLLAAPHDAADEIVKIARERGFDEARVIGQFKTGTGRIECK
ncbi:MAG: selenide, water dikinase SelD, partial [Pyramidobacter sp.]|nr:selenide, water dikinase SelD [Pyramidobacter sp.]